MFQDKLQKTNQIQFSIHEFKVPIYGMAKIVPCRNAFDRHFILGARPSVAQPTVCVVLMPI